MPQDFFTQDAIELAKALLGKSLVRVFPSGTEIALTISETEAYLGEKDLASHARFGKTKRNEAMYLQGGHFYVYLIYGMHHMLNVVSGKDGYPQAVLIRSTLEVQGPGRLCKFLQIDKSFDKLPVLQESGLYIKEGKEIQDFKVIEKPRIGVDYAKEWKDKKLRFVMSL